MVSLPERGRPLENKPPGHHHRTSPNPSVQLTTRKSLARRRAVRNQRTTNSALPLGQNFSSTRELIPWARAIARGDSPRMSGGEFNLRKSKCNDNREVSLRFHHARAAESAPRINQSHVRLLQWLMGPLRMAKLM